MQSISRLQRYGNECAIPRALPWALKFRGLQSLRIVFLLFENKVAELCSAERADFKRRKGERTRGEKMAGATGLEPATPSVTGWYSNQLSYAPASEE